MEKRFVVPEGGFKAALDAQDSSKSHGHTLIALEAFIRWQSENPIVPTDAQVEEMKIKLVPVHPHWANIVAEWQRRMYLAPELEPSQFSNLTKIEEGLNDALDKILLTYPQIIKTFPGIREKARGHFHSGIEELKKQEASEPKKTVQDWPILNPNCGEPGDFYRSPMRCLDCGNYFKSNSCPCKKKPEPEVPEEIKDLLYSSRTRVGVDCDPKEGLRLILESDRRTIEAFYRGQKSK